MSTTRSYATALRRSDEESKAPSHELSSSNLNRKSAKIDLRPGPLKTPSHPAKTAPDTSSNKVVAGENITEKQATEAKTVDVASSGKETDVAKTEVEAGNTSSSNILNTAKHDIEDAMQHGILRPPPEGAGRVSKLWHQLKELFVRLHF